MLIQPCKSLAFKRNLLDPEFSDRIIEFQHKLQVATQFIPVLGATNKIEVPKNIQGVSASMSKEENHCNKALFPSIVQE